MKHSALILFLAVSIQGQALNAETLVASRTLRAQTVLTYQDLALVPGTTPGALFSPDQAEGLEAKVTLYAGRPIRAGDLAPPALIERNQIVTLFYHNQGLRIATEARALGRAAEGDVLRVMNLSSRSTVSGTVDRHGRVVVGPRSDLLADLEKN